MQKESNRCYSASQFMTGYVGRLNIGVVPDPAVPIAAANTRRPDLDHYAVCFGRWIGNIL